MPRDRRRPRPARRGRPHRRSRPADGRGRRRPGGRIVAVGSDRDVGERIGAADAGHRAARPDRCCPGSRTPTATPAPRGSTSSAATSSAVHGARPRCTERSRAYAAGHPDAPMDRRERLVHGRLPARDAAPARPRRGRRRAAGVPREPRRSLGLGEQPGARAGRDRSPTTPDPAGGRIERDADGTPTGALHESAMDLVLDLVPPATADERERGLLGAQRFFHSLGITAWQDASVRPDCQAAYEALAGRGELTARVVAAMTFEAGWDVDAIDGLVERRARGPIGRFAATSVKFFVDGVLETFTGAMLEPYLGPDGGPADRTGILFHDPEVLRRAWSPRSTRPDSRSTCTRSAIGRSARGSTRSRARSSGQRTDRRASAHRPHPGHPARPTSPGSGRSGSSPTPRPLWAVPRAAAGRADDPVPRARERTRDAVPVRVAPARRRAAGDGQRLGRLDAERARRDAGRRRAEPPDRWARPRAVPGPRRRLTLDEAIHAFTMGSAYVNHLDDVTGLAHGRQAGRPGRRRPRPVGPRRRGRSATPGSSPRSSRASRSSRTRDASSGCQSHLAGVVRPRAAASAHDGQAARRPRPVGGASRTPSRSAASTRAGMVERQDGRLDQRRQPGQALGEEGHVRPRRLERRPPRQAGRATVERVARDPLGDPPDAGRDAATGGAGGRRATRGSSRSTSGGRAGVVDRRERAPGAVRPDERLGGQLLAAERLDRLGDGADRLAREVEGRVARRDRRGGRRPAGRAGPGAARARHRAASRRPGTGSGEGPDLVGVDRVEDLAQPAPGEQVDRPPAAELGVEALEPAERRLAVVEPEEAGQGELDALDLAQVVRARDPGPRSSQRVTCERSTWSARATSARLPRSSTSDSIRSRAAIAIVVRLLSIRP